MGREGEKRERTLEATNPFQRPLYCINQQTHREAAVDSKMVSVQKALILALAAICATTSHAASRRMLIGACAGAIELTLSDQQQSPVGLTFSSSCCRGGHMGHREWRNVL